jgi:hypothetical protein
LDRTFAQAEAGQRLLHVLLATMQFAERAQTRFANAHESCEAVEFEICAFPLMPAMPNKKPNRA